MIFVNILVSWIGDQVIKDMNNQDMWDVGASIICIAFFSYPEINS